MLSGSTGESSVLTDEEKVALWRAVAAAVTIPVIAGTGSNDTDHSVKMTALAAPCGVDGVLVVTPYYNRPRRPASTSTSGPWPRRPATCPSCSTTSPSAPDGASPTSTMLRLAHDVPAIVALKDAAGDPPARRTWRPRCRPGFEIYSGDDVMTLPLLAVGAVGVISVASHWVGPQFRRVIEAFLAGDLAAAIAGNAELLDSFDFQSTEEYPNPLPAKAICGPGPPRRAVPPAHGGVDPRARRPGRQDPGRRRPTRGHGRPACLSARKPKPVRVVFLGGLGEIGRNCACIEVDGRIIVLDCGIMFPDPDMPGVDLVLPEFTYLHDRADRVDGIVLTHGHEDHTGGLAYLLRDLQAPIYGSELTVGLARHRIEEAGLGDHTHFIAVADGERRRIGACDVEFIPVTHSVPEAMAIAFHTPQGVILHSGDFKLDLQPVDGRRTDLSRMGELARTEGIRLLLSDSTNAEEPGFTESESSVGVDPAAGLRRPVRQAHRRGLLRQPHAPGAADHRRRRRQRPQGGHAGALHGQERGAGHPARHHHHPRRGADRHRARRRRAPGRDVRDLHRLAGRADVGPLAHGDGGQQVAPDRRGRRGGHQRPPRSRATSGRWAR